MERAGSTTYITPVRMHRRAWAARASSCASVGHERPPRPLERDVPISLHPNDRRSLLHLGLRSAFLQAARATRIALGLGRRFAADRPERLGGERGRRLAGDRGRRLMGDLLLRADLRLAIG